MIVRLNIDELKNTEIVGVYNGKKINPYIEIYCGEHNLEYTLDKLLVIMEKNKSKILHLDYDGSFDKLEELLLSGKYTLIPVVVKKELKDIQNLELLMAGIPKNVKLNIILPKEFKDMSVVHHYSNKYENISFCGGNLIALKGCRLGCTLKTVKDIVSDDGCYRGYTEISIDDIEDLEFKEFIPPKTKAGSRLKKESASKEPKEKVKKESKPKSSKPKKQVSSLLARRLANNGNQ